MPASFGSLIQQGGDILVADGAVDPGARHKCPAWLRADLQTNLDAAKTFGTQQTSAEGARRTDSRALQGAYEDGDDLIRKISRWLNSLDADDNIPAQRAFYGLGPDLPRTFAHEEVERVLQTFVAAQFAQGLNPDAVLSATRLAKVNAVLSVIAEQTGGASIGDRADLTGEKVKAQLALDESIARVRYFLWAALPEMFKDPLLHNYGFVPRQEPAAAQVKPPTTGS